MPSGLSLVVCWERSMGRGVGSCAPLDGMNRSSSQLGGGSLPQASPGVR